MSAQSRPPRTSAHGYHTLELMTLVETGTRALLGAVFGPTAENETSYASRLLRPDIVLAENLVRAGHAACPYSWRIPPRRSRRRTSRRVICCGSVIGAGKGCSGREFAMP